MLAWSHHRRHLRRDACGALHARHGLLAGLLTPNLTITCALATQRDANMKPALLTDVTCLGGKAPPPETSALFKPRAL